MYVVCVCVCVCVCCVCVLCVCVCVCVCCAAIEWLRGDVKQTLRLLAETADSLSDGDIVDRRIRSVSQWGLLPVQVRYIVSPYLVPLQWNPSILDTNGAEESVIVSEVSSFQRLKWVQEWYLGREKVSCLEMCPHFRGVLVERGVPLYSNLHSLELPVMIYTVTATNITLCVRMKEPFHVYGAHTFL